LDGSFEGSANSQTKVVANFDVAANQTFSFDFLADVNLIAKEIENRNTEYNQANLTSTFLVLDTTNINQPKVLDYFGVQGKLISSQKNSSLVSGGSRRFTITNRDKTVDIDGNNGFDKIIGEVAGTYSQKFKRNTNITIVEVTATAVEFAGDTLIGNLGKDVTYGTIWNDHLTGTNGADKIYSSLGDDVIKGNKGDDILEGGKGNDTLFGGQGNDKLHGGWDDDVLIGGRGSDVLVGGEGFDKFIFSPVDNLFYGGSDVIQDFQVGIDKIVFQGWGSANSISNFIDITDTQDGVLFKFNIGWKPINRICLVNSQ
jgi:serralysin